ncbi:hypothetical protein HpBT223_01380 [Helicobacter pylori]
MKIKSFIKFFASPTRSFLTKSNKSNLSNQNKKKRAKCWLQPYITLSICLKRGFIPCGLNDLDPVSTTAKMIDKPKNTEILKKLFNFDSTELQTLIDFLR